MLGKLNNPEKFAFRLLLNRKFASAATQLQTVNPLLVTQKPDGLRVTRLPSGLLLATVDNFNPVSRLSLVFKAGSRYENPNNRGITHRLRNLVGLSTRNHTAVAWNYRLASAGAILTSSTTRDFFTLDVQIFRRHQAEAFRIFDELMKEPLHVNHRELEFSEPQMIRELDLLKDSWPSYILEKLHKAGHRAQPIAYSLLAPKYAIGSHTPEDLAEFAHEHFTTGNCVLAGVGINHDEVMQWASNWFPLRNGGTRPAPEKTTFYQGDVRKMRAKSDLVVVYIGARSVGINDRKGALAATVLANVLGTGPNVKWSSGGENRLAKAAKKATSNPFHVAASNIAYEGTGMFTLFYGCQWADSDAVAKALVGELKSVASHGVENKDLQAAKNRVKYRLLSLAESDDYILEDIAVQGSIFQSDVEIVQDQLDLVDAVTANDVQQAAKNIVNGKFAMASIGRLDKTPYADEL